MSIIRAKNELASASPFIWLFTLTLDNDTLYFARNTEDVVYQSVTYTAIPIEIGLIKSDDSGKIQSITVSISNIGFALGNLADQLVGAHEKRVAITLIAIVDSTPYKVFSINTTVIGATVDEKYVTFELGFANLLSQKFPQLVFTPNHCQWKFKDVECGYLGNEAKCDKTFTQCCSFSNENFPRAKFIPSFNCRPFGGFPALKKGIRVVK